MQQRETDMHMTQYDAWFTDWQELMATFARDRKRLRKRLRRISRGEAVYDLQLDLFENEISGRCPSAECVPARF